MIGKCEYCGTVVQSLNTHPHYQTNESVIRLCAVCYNNLIDCQNCGLIMHVSYPNQDCPKECFDKHHDLNQRVFDLEWAISRKLHTSRPSRLHRIKSWWVKHQKHYYKWLDHYSGNPSLGKRLFARVFFWGMPDS